MLQLQLDRDTEQCQPRRTDHSRSSLGQAFMRSMRGMWPTSSGQTADGRRLDANRSAKALVQAPVQAHVVLQSRASSASMPAPMPAPMQAPEQAHVMLQSPALAHWNRLNCEELNFNRRLRAEPAAPSITAMLRAARGSK